MNNLIKILHINPSWEAIYILVGEGIFVKSNVPLEKAITMLRNEKFDLILSEPQKIALLDHSTASGENLEGFPVWGKTHRSPEYQPGLGG